MDVSIFDPLAILVALISVWSWLRWRGRREHYLPLPPGPKGLPVIGNILDMPGRDEWETARQWGEKYGKSVRR